ncbi:hypothetical protein BHE74_00021497 [Ensete ventricosum]|nr:hypothetical protein BHE74_00021497 [Ensete ventricosum]
MEQALLVQARVRWLARGLLGTELKLDRMSGDPELGLGGRLLEWWSSGREEILQLGSAADSCTKAGSGRSFYSEYCRSFIHSNLTAFMVDHVVVPFHHTRRPCVKYLGRCKHCTSVSVPSAPPPSTSDSGGREGAPHGMASAVGVPAMRIRLAAQRQRKHENTAPHHLAPISFIPAVVGSCEMMGSQ